MALVLALIGMIVGANTLQANSGARHCGAVRSLVVAVEKGRVNCKTARGVVRRFIAVSGNCGGAMRPACVIKRFHCRAASPGEGSLLGYCYRLKKPRPAAQDFSFYKPKQFRAAITVRPSGGNT